MDRRTLLQSMAAGTLSSVLGPASGAQAPVRSALDRAIAGFAVALPGQTSVCVILQDGRQRSVHAANADVPLVVGSATKTFILAEYLRQVEAGTLSEDTEVNVGPAVWSPGSPVFLHLTGTTEARFALEAMIAHSDNTATDIALQAAGPERVRALILAAGLAHTRIPDSTRKMFSYLAGAPDGTDIGWAGMEAMGKDILPGKPRHPVNDRQTMMSTATEMTQWYEEALNGKYFLKPESLAEFKRISAMANALPMLVPEDTMAYGKGGSIDWLDFHCFCVAGQMRQGPRHTSFCFTVNWQGANDTVSKVFEQLKTHSRAVLAAAASA